MGKKLSKAIRKAYGVGSPSATEIKHLEQGAIQQVTLSEIINQNLRKASHPEQTSVSKQA